TMGSPGFMSPEQVEGREVGPASDVFSLGAVLAYAATGQNPFGDGAVTALMYRVVHGAPALDGIPEPLRSAVGWCLAKDPAQRPSPADLLAHLNGEKPAPAGSRYLAASASPSAVAASGARTSVAAHPPYSAAADPARLRTRQRAALAAVATVLIGGIAAVALLTAHQTASDLASNHRTKPSSSTRPSSSASAAVLRALPPQAVVKTFIDAVNAHDWPQVWQLGGKNLGMTYSAMVAGFGSTSHDVLTAMTTNGDTVSARVDDIGATGSAQVYALVYTVQNGAITSYQQTLLARQPARCLPSRAHCSGAGRAG
ncbi:MAG TPA: hypothetical protein VGS19_00475, partial [Streptosporangiaceae bacterium]|nr:hypothetical protein [Streptosporangiaceae bacterium]